MLPSEDEMTDEEAENRCLDLTLDADFHPTDLPSQPHSLLAPVRSPPSAPSTRIFLFSDRRRTSSSTVSFDPIKVPRC